MDCIQYLFSFFEDLFCIIFLIFDFSSRSGGGHTNILTNIQIIDTSELILDFPLYPQKQSIYLKEVSLHRTQLGVIIILQPSNLSIVNACFLYLKYLMLHIHGCRQISTQKCVDRSATSSLAIPAFAGGWAISREYTILNGL